MNATRPTLVALTTAIAALAPAPAAHAWTVTERHTLSDTAQLAVTCGMPSTAAVPVPAGAQNLRVLSPVVGAVPADGFGDTGYATIQSVRAVSASGRTAIEVTGVGSGRTCDPANRVLTRPWEQNVDVKATYETRRNVTPRVSDGGPARVRPKRLADGTFGPRSAWKKLRWRSWGGATAVATGRYTGRRLLIVKGFPKEFFFTYPVRITLSKPRPCDGNLGDNYRYSVIRTTFLRRTPADVRRQAKPFPSLCLRRG